VEDGLCLQDCERSQHICNRVSTEIFVHTRSWLENISCGEEAGALAFSLGYGKTQTVQASSPLELLSLLSGCKSKIKRQHMWVGRMGRPEKAKHREMKPLVHVLFPVGLKGVHIGTLWKPSRQDQFLLSWAKRKCPNCKSYTLK